MITIKGTTPQKPKKIAIIVAEFNNDITEKLLEQALKALDSENYPEALITVVQVPGAVEIGFVANRLARNKEYGAIICFGAVIKGETAHFEYVSQLCVDACNQVMLRHDIPVVFGVLTTFDRQQALARVNGNVLNMGQDAAQVALEMMSVTEQL
jgi:6,7-dimethyl-8-ribityllumazine synthase